MKAWHDLMHRILEEGEERKDRTGIGTISKFGETITLQNHSTFPAVTTKKLAFESIKEEMAYFIGGNHGDIPRVWRKWEEKGLGPIYGKQWRNWGGNREQHGHDQLMELYNNIRKDPYSRRHLVSAWNVEDLPMMSVPPCPFAFQVYISTDKVVDMVVYQRSCDVFLGLPFDIAGYALLQRLIAQSNGYNSGRLTFMIGDAHIYNNHVDQVLTVMERTPLPPPTLTLDKEATMVWFKPIQAQLKGYQHHGVVEAELNV